MNWFEPVFLYLVEWRSVMMEIWKTTIFGLVAYLGALLLGVYSPWKRLCVFLAGGVILASTPDLPLEFLSGRVAGLQNEVFAVLLAMLLGAVLLVRSIKAPTVAGLAGSIAALVICSLSIAYHMILLNGVDSVVRHEISTGLGHDYMKSGASLCEVPGTYCGEGFEGLSSQAFARDLFDYSRAAPEGALLAGSNGTLTSGSSYVWFAHKSEGSLRWVMRSYAVGTAAFETGLMILSMLAISFWIPGAILVEWLHARAAHGRQRQR